MCRVRYEEKKYADRKIFLHSFASRAYSNEISMAASELNKSLENFISQLNLDERNGIKYSARTFLLSYLGVGVLTIDFASLESFTRRNFENTVCNQ